jgi:dihydrofolate synthase/folylpolyglutamate synthase
VRQCPRFRSLPLSPGILSPASGEGVDGLRHFHRSRRPAPARPPDRALSRRRHPRPRAHHPLLDRVGNPHLRLPPVLHVAGTNGKGSTCAFLRAAIEAAGLTTHVYSSPHLVRFNERIRLAGTLIDEPSSPRCSRRCSTRAAISAPASSKSPPPPPSSPSPARLPMPASSRSGSAAGSTRPTSSRTRRHGDRPARHRSPELPRRHARPDRRRESRHRQAGRAAGDDGLSARHRRRGRSLRRDRRRAGPRRGTGVVVRGREQHPPLRDARGEVTTPLPALAGAHQPANLALAIAVLRHQRALTIPRSCTGAAARDARWPARMQRLSPGPLTGLLPPGPRSGSMAATTPTPPRR